VLCSCAGAQVFKHAVDAAGAGARGVGAGQGAARHPDQGSWPLLRPHSPRRPCSVCSPVPPACRHLPADICAAHARCTAHSAQQSVLVRLASSAHLPRLPGLPLVARLLLHCHSCAFATAVHLRVHSRRGALGLVCARRSELGPGRRVWTSGLEWNLDGLSAACLSFGHFISTSNRICGHVSSRPLAPPTRPLRPRSSRPPLPAAWCKILAHTEHSQPLLTPLVGSRARICWCMHPCICACERACGQRRACVPACSQAYVDATRKHTWTLTASEHRRSTCMSTLLRPSCGCPTSRALGEEHDAD